MSISARCAASKKRLCVFGLVVLALMLSFSAGILYGQGQPATLTGIVSDQSNAVIPNASVILKQESTGSLRRTVSNTDGYFTITGIQAGTHDVAGGSHEGWGKGGEGGGFPPPPQTNTAPKKSSSRTTRA